MLEMAEAEIDAMVKVENEFITLDRFPDDSSKYTKEYVHAHSNPSSSPENLAAALPDSGSVDNTYENSRAHFNVQPTHLPLKLISQTSLSSGPYETITGNPVLSEGHHKSVSSVGVTPVPVTKPHMPSVFDSNIQVDSFARVLSEQVNLNRLPLPEPGTFDGDPLKYPGWKCTLDSLLENRGIPPSEKIYYLKRYLTGSPKEALEGYFLIPTDSSYEEARSLLQERYGNPIVVMDAFRSKLEAWPKIQPNDGLAFVNLATFWVSVKQPFRWWQGSCTLNGSWENRKLLTKLPSWLVTRWGRFVADWGGIKVIDPRFCRKRITCKRCGRPHPTAFHGDFKPKSETQREQSGSISRNVSTTSVSVQTQPLEVQKGFNHMSGANKANMSSLILPVYISHKGNPNKEILTYAMLDTQSDTTFVTECVCEALGVKGTRTQLALSTMISQNHVVNSNRVEGLIVRGHDSSNVIPLPMSYTRYAIPVNRTHIPSPVIAQQWPYLKEIANNLMPVAECDIGLLIGYNCPKALVPRQVIPPVGDGPYAQRTDLGWGIVGMVDPDEVEICDHDSIGLSHLIVTCEVPTPSQLDDCREVHICFRTKVKEIMCPEQVARMMELEFNEGNFGQTSYSQEDVQFLSTLKEGVHIAEDGHYEMPLPLRSIAMNLPNNRSLAWHRLSKLQKRLEGDIVYARDYCAFMQDIISKGFAERVPVGELTSQNGNVNFIPHHGIYHPKKPGKIRVVFDCSATFKGVSLNDYLLTGPNLTNTLVGVLCRFRQESVAFMGDIEAMFYQFKVNKEQRDLLRFLWWQNGDFTSEPVEYRMTVHLFGAGSSPGCANFGLKQIASDYEKEFGPDVTHFIHQNFYVDDGLKSVSDANEAIDLISRTKDVLKKGGIRFHKIVSNSRIVMRSVPSEDQAGATKDLDLCLDPLPIERALGVQWCIESDVFQFKITLKDQPLTRRGILSTVSSVYDPLGFVSPVVLIGKQILQSLCNDHMAWDCPLPEELRATWENWRRNLCKLDELKFERCYKPVGFGKVVRVELHHFCDASTKGYGHCSYLRLQNGLNQVHCAFVMGKARVAPIKSITIPRLELTAAVLSVKISLLLRKELEYDNISEFFWTDSQVY
ncbi:hypothetical protein BSL78_03264 [Apostichopus japonicus]|uniref:Reverse transcriptase domain-containing protein n=1 Tax=Stichopus japonicus TaxID=307972 RepID=A0A2G8LHS7_STIJA|nr:hypothetical protein BSL78_03264 [Apostichopus japonicus]